MKGTHGRESMRRHRSIATAALLAVSCLFAAPVTAQASSTLLSGYGSPGEGNQAIIGSALIGGGGGGGSTGSSGSGSTTVQAAEGGQAGGTATSGTTPSVSPSKGSRASGGTTSRSRHAGPSRPSTAGSPKPAPVQVAVRAADDPLGVTGEDLLYVILALIVLAGTAGATALLVRGPQRSSGS
jgi:hypothetical protein